MVKLKIQKYFYVLYSSFIFLAILGFSETASANRDQKGAITFLLIDGETNKPIPNHKITVCGETIKFRRLRDKNFKYCKTVREIHPDFFMFDGKTGDDGILYLERKAFDDDLPQDIIFDVDLPYQSVPTGIEKSDGLGHRLNPKYIRVVNINASGRVVSNKLFNLDTNMVTEISLSNEKKEYFYSTIDVIVFKEPNE